MKDYKYSMRMKTEDIEKVDALCEVYNLDARPALILKLIRDEYDRKIGKKEE